ncbi:glycosyltransferase family 2 protein [Micrococcus luteus]|uniref:glycosyltransferase family 2 protein n=1 Tax=Micrococcus luteus TaxID=1270 RepID=UPI00119E70F0|nr:glycosyltransferase [Micrococcus luteus]
MQLKDARGQWRMSPRRLTAAAGRRIALPVNYGRLVALSRAATEPIVDPNGTVVVSMTTHGTRLESVHLTIESIARGTIKPKQFVLALDAPILEPLPEPLRRLCNRGLEVLESPGRYGPHTKYFPYVLSAGDHQLPLVTADDDVIYDRRWLERLVLAAKQHPGEILCYRAHKMRLDGQGALAPYNSWSEVRDTDASHLNFLTGVSGVYYPLGMIAELRERGDAFMATCPKADDVWLNRVALQIGVKVRQIRNRPRVFPTLMSTQETSLLSVNVGRSANDEQLARTYSQSDLARLTGQR